jgi:hypothetical protein
VGLSRCWVLGIAMSLSTAAHAACYEVEKVAWPRLDTFSLTVEAYALGSSCAKASIVLLVTDNKGALQWSFARDAKTMMWFEDNVTDGAAMKLRLKEWLQAAVDASPSSTAALPDWKAGAEQPEIDENGETGFYAGEGAVRSDYLEMRAKGAPLFCFVSGIESTTCLVAHSDTHVTEIGGFSF